MINFFRKQNNKKGFSLVETLIALFVFSIAIVATMTVMSQGVSNITNSKNKIIASFLAQEGIEYIRNIRDTQYLKNEEDRNQGWSDFVDTFNCYPDGCSAIVVEEALPQLSDSAHMFFGVSNYNVYFSKNSGYYIQYENYGDKTNFSRKIYVEILDSDTVRIVSEVSFTQNGKVNKVSFTDYLTNWIE